MADREIRGVVSVVCECEKVFQARTCRLGLANGTRREVPQVQQAVVVAETGAPIVMAFDPNADGIHLRQRGTPRRILTCRVEDHPAGGKLLSCATEGEAERGPRG